MKKGFFANLTTVIVYQFNFTNLVSDTFPYDVDKELIDLGISVKVHNVGTSHLPKSSPFEVFRQKRIKEARPREFPTVPR